MEASAIGKNTYLLLEIFFTFFKLGSISFGGGYAMVPLIEHETVEKKKWVDHKQIVDIFAVAESLPGAIGLNASALVGHTVAGVPGTLSAIFGNLTPSVIIVLLLTILFAEFNTYPWVQAVFSGIRPAVIALIFYAAYKIGKVSILNRVCIIIALLAFSGMMFFHAHPILIIVLGAFAGIIATNYKKN
ncbi:chromate transporter [Sporomusa aerivorans]|uniref:chromate transporter n=1 Tax=Sporomusa aerivorans TaxID=204936 RepID=UPI00352AF979